MAIIFHISTNILFVTTWVFSKTEALATAFLLAF